MTPARQPRTRKGRGFSGMKRISLTYGELPSEDTMGELFDEACPDGTFAFGNDPRMGNETVTFLELRRELKSAVADWADGDEPAGGWASRVLSALGVEWV